MLIVEVRVGEVRLCRILVAVVERYFVFGLAVRSVREREGHRPVCGGSWAGDPVPAASILFWPREAQSAWIDIGSVGMVN